MIKTLFLLLLSLLFLQSVKAQKQDTTLLYMKNTGEEISSKDSADYMLLIMPPSISQGIKLYPVDGFYMNGKPKLNEMVTIYPRNGKLIRQGPCVEFYSNGHRKNIANFKDGNMVGNIIEYYSNGQYHCTKKIGVNNQIRLIDCYDSTGKIIAENGNGNWIKTDDDFKGIAEQGTIKDSLETG